MKADFLWALWADYSLQHSQLSKLQQDVHDRFVVDHAHKPPVPSCVGYEEPNRNYVQFGDCFRLGGKAIYEARISNFFTCKCCRGQVPRCLLLYQPLRRNLNNLDSLTSSNKRHEGFFMNRRCHMCLISQKLGFTYIDRDTLQMG